VAEGLVRAPNALLRQSCCDAAGECHRDGWGIAFFQGREPVVERGTAPASEEARFRAVAEAICARTVVAHIRAASVGGASLENTHPFTHGCWLFAHNGTVTAFDQVRPTLEAETPPPLLAGRRGNTDSELLFCWLLGRMAAPGLNPEAPCDDLPSLTRIAAEAVREVARRCDRPEAEEPAGLNWVLTDGTVLLASRWGRSLYWWTDGPDCETRQAVVIASEPTGPGDWREVPPDGLLTVDAGLAVTFQSLR
jgi:glutamine amidotransferase